MYLSCLKSTQWWNPGTACTDLIFGNSTNCCYIIDCELRLSPGQFFAQNILRIFVDPLGTPCPVAIVEVNGQPYIDPFPSQILLDVTQPIGLKLQICPCELPPNCWTFNIFITINSGGSPVTIPLAQQPSITEINPQAAPYLPVPATFTSLTLYPCIGTSNCSDQIIGTIPFTNTSDFDTAVIIDDGGNFPIGTVFYVDGIAQPFNIMVVPARASVQLGFGFCWPNSTPATFPIFVEICDVYSWRVDITISPVFCLGCGINCIDFEILTENTYLPDYSAGCGFGLPTVYTEAAIGEKKTLVWHYSYNNGFVGGNVDIYFNPYLFTDIASVLPIDPYLLSIPNVGWFRKVQGFMVGNGPYAMQQVTQNQYRPNQKNWEATIEVINANEFKISFTFFLMMDIDNGVTNAYLENWKKLWFNNVYAVNPGDFITYGSDVYKADVNTPRYFANDFLLVDNNVSDPNSSIERPYRCYLYNSFPIAARWYNKGIGLTNSEFFDPIFTFLRGSGPSVLPSPSLSIFEKTIVRFYITISPAYTPTAMVAYVMDLNSFDDSVDFQTNYAFSRAEILTNGAPSVLNNDIESPSLGPTIIGTTPGGDNIWGIEFIVGAGVRSTGNYAIAVIVYDDVNNIVNTFITPNFIVVDLTPSADSLCCPLNVQSSWSDYINTYTNVYPHVTNYKQRLNNSFNITGGQFQTNCLLGNFGYFQSWQTLIKDITLKVYRKRITGFGAFYSFIYYQYQSIRDLSYPGDFNNLSNEFTVKNIGSGQLQMDWFGRGRWESWIQFPSGNVYNHNPLTPYNLNNVGPIVGQLQAAGLSYDWSKKLNSGDIGGEILFDYTIRFDLTNVLNLPNNAPFYVNKVIQQSLWMYSEEPLTTNTQFNVSFGDLFDPLLLEGWNGLTYIALNGPFCSGEFEHIRATLTSPSGLTGYLIGFWNKSPYGILTLKEDNGVNVSPSSFTQLDYQYIYDVSPGVQSGTWEFKIDPNAFPPGTYELCAQYLPLIP